MDKRFDVINRIFINERGLFRCPVEQKEYCVRHLDEIIALLPDYIEELYSSPHLFDCFNLQTTVPSLLSIIADIVNGDELDLIMNKIRKKVPMRCPEKGEFIGYKKVFIKATYIRDVQTKIIYIYSIAKLRIPETAQRSSAFGSKCRCSEAFVEEITSMDGSIKYDSAVSMRGTNPTPYLAVAVTIDDTMSTKYIVGETVKPDSFDPNWWNECSNGIHFFMTREEAENYIP